MVKLISPENNALICQVIEPVKAFYDEYKKQQKKVKNDYVLTHPNWGLKTTIEPKSYYDDSYHFFAYSPVIFKIDSKMKLFICLSLDKNFNNTKKLIQIKNGEAEVFNLLRNETYFWKIVDKKNNDLSEVRSFKIDDYPRAIKIGSIINVRDFGGYNTKHNKRIKQNLLIRGYELVTKQYTTTGKLKANQTGHTHYKFVRKQEKKEFNNVLPSGIEIDLRGDRESNYQTKSCMKGFDYQRFPHFASYDTTITLDDPVFIEEFRNVIELISHADEKPVYLHCWGGADRTGTLCFFLGALLGMSYTDLIIEYELTSFGGNIRRHYNETRNIVWLRFEEFTNELIKYGKAHKLSNLDEIVEHIFINCFKISSKTIERIKTIFLD